MYNTQELYEGVNFIICSTKEPNEADNFIMCKL